jgi:hypothetical protein
MKKGESERYCSSSNFSKEIIMNFRISVLLFMLALTLFSLCQAHKKMDKIDFPVLKGPYLGQNQPGRIPEIFARGIISKEKSAEYGGHFSPDGSEFFFTRYSPGEHGKIWMARIKNGNWTVPQSISFLGDCHGAESCMSPDG